MKKFRFLSFVISLGIINAICPFTISAQELTNDTNESVLLPRSGALPEGDDYKKLDFYGGDISSSDVANDMQRSLPSYVDLSSDPCFPPLGDQGNLGSCTAFATTYYQFSYEVNKLNNITSSANRVVYSPKWTYNWINNGQDGGSYVTDALLVLRNYGALKISDLPYDSNYTWIPGNTNLNSNEMIPERLEALETRLSTFYSLTLQNYGTFITESTDSNLNNIKNKLNNGKVLTTTTVPNFNYKYGYDHNNNQIKVNYRCYGSGGHTMTIVGYDDNVTCDVNNNGIIEDCERGAFKLADSYGTNGTIYDTNGYMWVLYDAINAVSANNVNAWEQNLPGIRTQAFCCETYSPTFWYINVSNYDVNYVGEIDINTGSYELGDSQYKIGRSSTGNDPNYVNSNMLPVKIGPGAYNGKIFFDYHNLCPYIHLYLSGYNWYVNFNPLYGNYNLKAVDNLYNLIANYGNQNNVAEKNVNISTMLGDLNYSGNLSLADSTMVQEYLLQLREFSTLQKVLADCNQDGIIDMSDAVYIEQHM
ncbi:MAG: hypothetical protein KA982_04485 [Clostridia bacterium]|nr:hypothetical protein [Clostridia bacterium]